MLGVVTGSVAVGLMFIMLDIWLLIVSHFWYVGDVVVFFLYLLSYGS